jgi:hypothetical protein
VKRTRGALIGGIMSGLRTPVEGLTRRALLAAGGCALITFPRATNAAGSGITLIMVDDPNCKYCRKFEAEIGGRYPKTEEGRFAPLFKVRRKSRELAGFDPIIYTPTFLLVRGTTEAGRITGYPGAQYFFPELGALLAKVGFMPGLSGAPSRT